MSFLSRQASPCWLRGLGLVARGLEPQVGAMQQVSIFSAGDLLSLPPNIAVVSRWNTGDKVSAQHPARLCIGAVWALVQLPGGRGQLSVLCDLFHTYRLIASQAVKTAVGPRPWKLLIPVVALCPKGLCSSLGVSWIRVLNRNPHYDRKSPAVSLPCCVTYSELFDFSRPQFLCLKWAM